MPKLLPKRQATLFASVFEGSFRPPTATTAATAGQQGADIDDQLAFVFDVEPLRRKCAATHAETTCAAQAAVEIVWTEDEVRLLIYAMVEHYQQELRAHDQKARNYAYWWMFLDEDAEAPFSFPWFCKLHGLDLESARDYICDLTIHPIVRSPSTTAQAA